MSVHIHTLRSYCAGTLGLLILAMVGIQICWAYEPPAREFELAEVTGRVTCGGRPLGGEATIPFVAPDDRPFDAAAAPDPDRSFPLLHVSNLAGHGILRR